MANNQQIWLPNPIVQKFNLCNYSLRWSPSDEARLAVAQSQYFGLVGSGAVSVCQVMPNGVQTLRQFQTPDSTFDVCFNEANTNQVLAAGGDGSIKLFDSVNQQQGPIMVSKGHQGEVYGVEWNHINKRMVLTASFDKTIGLWDATQLAQGPKQRFAHQHTVYGAIWHPTHESIFASCSGDQTCKVWDLRSGKDVKSIHAHTNEILSIDFNKYENFIATASADCTIKLWDLRSTTDSPIMILTAHQLAVRRVKFSPYHANILASASYDMSTIVWDCNLQTPMNKFDHHSEFVVGVDFNMFREGYFGTASWDKSVGVMKIDDNPRSVLQAAGMV